MTSSMTDDEKVDLPGAVPADYIEMTNAISESGVTVTDVTAVGYDVGQ